MGSNMGYLRAEMKELRMDRNTILSKIEQNWIMDLLWAFQMLVDTFINHLTNKKSYDKNPKSLL